VQYDRAVNDYRPAAFWSRPHFSRGLLKTKDNAGGWLSNLRPTVCVQSGKIEVRRLVHQSAIFSS